MASLGNHEVVRISRKDWCEGCLKLREYAFLTDHTMHQRLTVLDTDDQPLESTGWQKIPHPWSTFEKLYAKLLKMESAGWVVVWGAGHGKEPTIGDYLQTVEW